MAKSTHSESTAPAFTGQHVYLAISSVSADIIELGGIAKGRENKEQNFWFRGFEDVVSVVSPLLVKHKIVFLPAVKSVEYLVRETPAYKEGQPPKRANFTFIQMDFRIVSLVDGSETIVQAVGEGKDHGDKATNKAMTIALKYAMTMAFQIPTYVDDQEADETQDEPEIDQRRGGISEEQIAQVKALRDKLGVTDVIVCKSVGAKTYEEISPDKLPGLLKRLNDAIEKKGGNGG
jgi:hypothetical protein